VTLASFLESFPEFTEVNTETPDLVPAKLAEAHRRVAAGTVSEFVRDDLVGYLAAHLTAISPQGQQARLSASDGQTTYWVSYQALKLAVPTGPMYA
jgi:hypothetical protein